MDSGQQREGRPHPILKFIGTALTVLIGAGLLTTLLTIESEGRERDAALKGSLVKDISTSLARTSLTARFIVTGSYGVEEPNIAARPSRLRQRYNEGQQAWEQAAASIEHNCKPTTRIRRLQRSGMASPLPSAGSTS